MKAGLPLPSVHFYFYLGCPWTYLAFMRLRESALRTGGLIVWQPVLIGRVRASLPGRGAAAHGDPLPARTRYQAKDLADWARFCGVSIRRPGPYPVAADAAQKAAVAAIEAGLAESFMESVFVACFENGADIDAPDVVAAVARSVGIDGDAIRRAQADAGCRRILNDNSDELVRRGGFGSPTMFIGDDMYFGNDRMPLVELALGRAADRPLVVPGAHGQV